MLHLKRWLPCATLGTLCSVRVEVHLEGGVELGPTDGADIAAGASVDVTLAAGDNDFDRWTAHPEISSCAR